MKRTNWRCSACSRRVMDPSVFFLMETAATSNTSRVVCGVASFLFFSCVQCLLRLVLFVFIVSKSPVVECCAPLCFSSRGIRRLVTHISLERATLMLSKWLSCYCVVPPGDTPWDICNIQKQASASVSRFVARTDDPNDASLVLADAR